jgi:hypothetical protein
MRLHRLALLTTSLLAASASQAEVNFYTSSADYFAALAAAPEGSVHVGRGYDFENEALDEIVTNPNQPYFPNQIDVAVAPGVDAGLQGRIGNTYNKFGNQSLEAFRGANPDKYFYAGESVTVGTGDESTNAFSVFVNIQPSDTPQLFLEYTDPLSGNPQTFFGGAGAYDTSTFYFLGVIATNGNTAFRFGALDNAASGFNVDNINLAAPVPEPTPAWLLAAGLAGLALLRRRAG